MPKLRGLVRAGHSTRLRRRPIASVLAPQFEYELVASAEVMSEGSANGIAGEEHWFGSTMFTIDLGRFVPHRYDANERMRECARLFDRIAGSVRVRVHTTRRALEEVARRHPGVELGTANIETSLQLMGETLLVDVDLEVPIGLCSVQTAT